MSWDSLPELCDRGLVGVELCPEEGGEDVDAGRRLRAQQLPRKVFEVEVDDRVVEERQGRLQ